MLSKGYRSLTKQLIQIVFCIFFVAILVVSVCNFFMTKYSLEQNMQREIEQSTQYHTEQISSWLSVRIEQLYLLRHNIEAIPIEERTDEAVLALVTDSTTYGKSYDIISDYVVWENKKMISGDGWIPDPDYDATQNDYYQKTKTQDLYISEPYIDATTKEFVVTISIPLYTDGVFSGVLGRDIKITEIQNMIDQYESEDGGYLYLLDQSGNVMSHKNSAFETTENSVVSIFDIQMELLQQVTTKMVHIKDYDGMGKYIYAKQEPNSGWTVGVVYPDTIARTQLFAQTSIILVIFLISLFGALTILIYTFRKKLSPIHDIIQSAKALEHGEFDNSITVQSSDEIGMLSQTFQQTGEYLRKIISEISEVLTQMANGNLCVEIKEEYRGEFLDIQKAINTISEQMNEIIGNIDVASEQIFIGTSQTSQNAHHLSQTSIQQSEQIESIVANMKQMKNTMNESADSCEYAEKITQNVAEKLKDSNVQMNHMLQEMEKINMASEQINQITKTIEDIAFQTNILALNAAVEAARAGEAGKGFAVVADEVRQLANKSAEAAQRTTTLIETTLQNIKQSDVLAEKSANVLQEALTFSHEIVEKTQEIAVRSSEQVIQIDHMAQTIDSFSNVVQNNAHTAKENAMTSEQMRQQSESLKKLMQKFKTK